MPDPVTHGRAQRLAAARRALALGALCLSAPSDAPRRDADAWATAASHELVRLHESPALSTTAQLSRELDLLERATLTPLLTARGPAVPPRPRGDIPLSGLDRAQRAAPARGLVLAEAEPSVEPAPSRDLSALASTRASVRLHDSGTMAEVRGPSVATAAPVVVSGTVSDVARVMAGLRAGFRACYAAALKSDPSAAGVLGITFEVGSDGSVTRVRTAAKGTFASSLVACIQARAHQARFPAPGGGGAVLTVPVTFVPR